MPTSTTRRTCPCCHKLPKFCVCPTGAKPTCPICGRLALEGEHFPKVDCSKRSAPSEERVVEVPIQSTISTNDVPTLHSCLSRFVEEAAILVDLRLSILDMDRRGQLVGAAAEHYESIRQNLIDTLQTAHLPHEEVRRAALRTPSIFASWSRSAATSWARTLKMVSERLRSAVDRSTSA